MQKVKLSGIFIGLAIMAFANLTASAQTSKQGVIRLNGGGNEFVTTVPAEPFIPAMQHDSNLVTIYSTLGTGNNVYSVLSGLGILGKDTGQLYPEKVANGFRPKADHVVTEVQVGAWHFQGTNSLLVSLNADDHGKPGAPFHTWRFTNLPTMWTCCTLQTGKYPKGIPVKKGKMYWVMVRPEKKFQDTWDTLADNFAGTQGPTFANNIGFGWDVSYQVLSAIGVFGK